MKQGNKTDWFLLSFNCLIVLFSIKRKLVETKEVIIEHYGQLSYEEIGYLLNKMTASLNRFNLSFVLRKKVYAAMVESLENVYKHQDVIEGNTNYFPRFSLVAEDEYIKICASNSVENRKKDNISQRIDEVNNLDRDGLKDLYKEIILHGSVSEKGGAGLGIVNIAKVTENKLEYKFDKINDRYSYYTLNIKVNQNTTA